MKWSLASSGAAGSEPSPPRYWFTWYERCEFSTPRRPACRTGSSAAGTLDELLATSDILCLHVPLTGQTRALIGRRELLLLPPGAVVVNVARGGVLDEEALIDLLGTGHIAGAGLDVFETEPLLPLPPSSRPPTRSCRRIVRRTRSARPGGGELEHR